MSSRARHYGPIGTIALTGLAMLGALLLAPGAAAAPPVEKTVSTPLEESVEAVVDSAAASARPAETRPSVPLAPLTQQQVDAVERALAAWDLRTARAAVESIPAGPVHDAKAGAVAFNEADYPRAESLLAGALASDKFPSNAPLEELTRHYLELARGAQRAMPSPKVIRSADGKVELVCASERDALIAPYLFKAMADARAALGADLGVWPDEPVRFELLDAPEKLALVTPLTRDNVYTTGTVGVTKYRRIMMITPRVMPMGYPWIDTAVHEYVHYLVTLRTGNNAPVWVQEGLAKLFEQRWRRSGATPLEPASAELLQTALTKDELITLDAMYPSVAMLPSQEQAALAYAEVQTMLALLQAERGEAGLGVLLDEIARGVDARAALATAWGDRFERFQESWRSYARRETARVLKHARARDLRKIEFVEPKEGEARGPDEPDPELLGDVFSHLGGGKARQHARLGVLLTLRGHLGAAARQYERARALDDRARRDPLLARRLGELYLRLGEPEDAVPLLELAGRDDPDQPNIAAAEGRARLRAGDLEGARAALARALRVNPFIPAVHCDLATLEADEEPRARERALCKE